MPDIIAVNFPSPLMPLTDLAAALRGAAREGATPASTLLKMDRAGVWTMGVEAEPVDATQQFAVNPYQSTKGFICWKAEGTEKLAEHVVPINAAIPELGPVPPGGRGWEYQMGIAVRAIGGELDGREASYRTSSGGGRRAISAFMNLMGARAAAASDGGNIVPVVTFSSDSYPNKRYGGRTYNPVITIIRWISMSGPAKAEAEPEVKRIAPAKRNGKRR